MSFITAFQLQIYSSGDNWYYAVAVAKEQDPDTDLTYLRGKNTCHTGLGTAAGWVFPLAYLISNGWIRYCRFFNSLCDVIFFVKNITMLIKA